MMKVGFISLGCAKNLMDTEVMLHRLVEDGFELTVDESEADVIIINTCAFIESAKKESIDTILDVARLKEEDNLKAIIVTGCLAERYREDIINELPEVDAVLGVGSIHNIAEAVRAAVNGKKYSSYEDKNTVKLGGGISISLSAATHRGLTKATIDLCKEKELPVMAVASPSHTGTNSPSVNLVRAGVPTVDVGLPLRNMHTYNEVINLDDCNVLCGAVREFISSADIAKRFGREDIL